MGEERSEWPAKIKNWCEQIRDLPFDEVVGTGNREPHTFPEQTERVRGMQFLATRVWACDLDNIPEDVLQSLASTLSGVFMQLTSMREQCRNRMMNSANRVNLANAMPGLHAQLFGAAAPLVAFATTRGTDLQELERQATVVRDRLRSIEVEGDVLLATLRTKIGDEAVTKQGAFFDSQAKSHASGAKLWMGLVVGVAALIAVLAVLSMTHPPVHDDVPLHLVSQWLPRLAIASILFWGLALCARNYRAHRHNEIVNQHRALSLKTFSSLVAATNDPQVKAAVLAQAASTIFANAPSGYAPDQAEPFPHATAVELLQRIGTK